MSNLAHLERNLGNNKEALEYYRETIIAFRDIGQTGAVAHQLECFGFIAVAQGQNERALQLFAAANALREKAGTPMRPEEKIHFDQQLKTLREKMNSPTLEWIWSKVHALSMDDAIALAIRKAMINSSTGRNLPSGTVTFLFTDIEGSTQLWEKHPQEMKHGLARHDFHFEREHRIDHGFVIKTTGDGFHAVFERAMDGIQAAILAQSELHSIFNTHSEGVYIKARMGLHTGEAEFRDGDFYGQSLNRAVRLMALAHGGQILLSAITSEVAREHLPEGTSLYDLGEHHLKDIVHPEHIYQLNTPGLPVEFPALNTLNNIPNNLPMQLTSFIGRENEIDEIRNLDWCKPHGHAYRLRRDRQNPPFDRSGDTIASIFYPRRLADRACTVIGAVPDHSYDGTGIWLKEHPYGPLEILLMDYLRDKKILIILDNCEHLIEACARLSDDLLHRCAGLQILASSREALGIAGEVAYHTPSLGDLKSTRLFVERACAVNPKFSLTEANTSSVAQICHRLDGIPLAIELAAARTRMLSVEQIAARLDDLFRLLVGGSRTALPRQQTLRALIDWSYDLLSDEEKHLLRTASVFVGGWNLDALEAVTDSPNTFEHLEQLVNKSLVITEERRTEMRYLMLETIRQYARESCSMRRKHRPRVTGTSSTMIILPKIFGMSFEQKMFFPGVTRGMMRSKICAQRWNGDWRNTPIRRSGWPRIFVLPPAGWVVEWRTD